MGMSGRYNARLMGQPRNDPSQQRTIDYVAAEIERHIGEMAVVAMMRLERRPTPASIGLHEVQTGYMAGIISGPLEGSPGQYTIPTDKHVLVLTQRSNRMSMGAWRRASAPRVIEGPMEMYGRGAVIAGDDAVAHFLQVGTFNYLYQRENRIKIEREDPEKLLGPLRELLA